MLTIKCERSASCVSQDGDLFDVRFVGPQMPAFVDGQLVDPPANADRTLTNVPKGDLRTPNAMLPFD